MRYLLFILLLIAPSMAWADHTESHDLPPSLHYIRDSRMLEMQALDVNQDGLLEVEELALKAENAFNHADADQDGVISSKEMEASQQEAKTKSMALFGREAWANKHAMRMKFYYKSADENNDRKISRTEYEAYFQRRYDAFDRNGDGIVTVKEYRTDFEKLPGAYKRKITNR